MIDGVYVVRQVGQNEFVVCIRRHEVDAGIGQMNRVSLFIEHVEQIVLDIAELLLARRKAAVGGLLAMASTPAVAGLDTPPALSVLTTSAVYFPANT